MAKRSYRDECEAHARAMEKLGRDLAEIRRRVQEEKLASHNGTTFGNLLADMILDGYLQDATKLKVKKAAA